MTAEHQCLHATSSEAAYDPATQAAATATPALSKRLIRLADLFALIDVSKPTGHRLLAAGKIGPRPLRLTPAIVRFDALEVEQWLRHRQQDGSLHDMQSWAPVWDALKRKLH